MTVIDSVATLWPEIQLILRRQMTQATYDTIVAQTYIASIEGSVWTIAAPTEMAHEWLTTRLYEVVRKAVASLAGEVELRFVVSQNGHTHEETAIQEPTPIEAPEQPADETAELLARADYIAGFFRKGGAGWSQIAHHTTRFWMQILGPAFLLWKYLDSLDNKRRLDEIDPNFWSAVFDDFFFQDLAEKLNRQKSRYITGEADECNYSRDSRLKHGRPLAGPADCCWGQYFEYVRFKNHPTQAGVMMCMRWREGQLEALRRHHLIRVALDSPTARKPKIQVWRMLPILTPWQVESFLNRKLQNEYLAWLDDYGKLFGLRSRTEWKRISQKSVIPLMPGYSLAETADNYDDRLAWQEFIQNAVRNPKYLPCMGDISESEGGGD